MGVGQIYIGFISPPLSHVLPLGQQVQQQVLSRLQALEKRFETLEAAASLLELQRGKTTEGPALSHEDTLALLDGLVRRRESVMRDEFHAETNLHVQVSNLQAGPGTLVFWTATPRIPKPAKVSCKL